MRALVYNGPLDLAVEDVEEPSPGSGELLVDVLAAGICGSDVHGYAGETGRRVPGIVPAKLRAARRMGATALDTAGSSLAAELNAAGQEHVDAVIDAVGLPATFSGALTATRWGGTVCIVGLGARQLPLEAFELTVGARSIVGSYCYTTAEFDECAGLAGRGEVAAEAFIDRSIRLEEAPEAFLDLAQGKSSSVKTIVLPNGSAGQEPDRS